MTAADTVAELNEDGYVAWRKELVNKLKDWEKKYHKHAKGINPEMNAIHTGCMRPLANLMDSNFNFYNFRVLATKNKQLPDFRYNALEEKYIEHFTKICEIFTNYGKL